MLWLPPKIKDDLPDLIQIVIGCVTKEKKVTEEGSELKDYLKELQCRTGCNMFDENSANYKACYNGCLEN